MESNQLSSFIQAQRAHGIPDSEITEGLKNAGWSMSDIQNAFYVCGPISSNPVSSVGSIANASLSSNPNPVTNTSASASVAVQIPQQGVPAPGIEGQAKRSKVFTFILIIFILLGTTFVIEGLVRLFMIILLNSYAPNPGNTLFYISPIVTFLPIIYSIEAFIIYFIGFKQNSGSKKGLIWSIIGFTLIPVIFVVVNNTLLMFSNAQMNQGVVNTSFISIINFIVLSILPILGLITTLVANKKYSFQDVGISTKGKAFLTVFVLIVIIPIIGYTTYGFINAKNYDWGYSVAQAKVSYHIYKPSYIPQDMDYASEFTDQELLNIGNSSFVILSTKLDLTTGKIEKVISIRQTSVKKGFDLENYINESSPNKNSIKDITISKAKGTSYLVESFSEDNTIVNSIAFISKDDVLIILNSTGLSTEELKNVANSLE